MENDSKEAQNWKQNEILKKMARNNLRTINWKSDFKNKILWCFVDKI